MAGHSLVISHAKRADFEAAYAFHSRHVGDYLWPRTEDAFTDLIVERQLYIVKDGQRVSGLCYLVEEDPREWEFGGIYIDEELRGLGVGAALGRVAISTSFVTDDAPERLIAHVHEFNEIPRRLLTDQLGFEATTERAIPPDPPPNMKRNASGDVVGDVFQFHLAALADFVAWFEAFTGVLVGKRGDETPLTIVADVWTQRGVLLPALLELSGVGQQQS